MNDEQNPGRLARVLAVATKPAPPPTVSGRVLRKERRDAEIGARALCRHMGISHETFYDRFDRNEAVTWEHADEYRKALAELASQVDR